MVRLPFLATCYLSSRYLAVKETKLYEILTYNLHAASGYRVELQRREYTEQHTPENNIYI